MIIAFHNFILFVAQLYKEYRKQKFLWELRAKQKCIEYEVNKHTSVTIDSEKNVRFDPPVYKLRYEAVQRVLLDDKWRSEIHKIVDFGAAEFGLFIFLKRLFGLTEIVEVDIDEDVLRDNLFKLRPLTVDYLKRRDEPLCIKVFSGSVCDPDPVLVGTDAVIAIELIEHLYPNELEAVPYNVFSFIRPRVAIFTTPNQEFNAVFLKSNEFRHADHKFEWTREQFQSWSLNITARFPEYNVYFAGIGGGTVDVIRYGHCTQMAIFVRNYVEEEISAVSLRNQKSIFSSKNSQADDRSQCKLSEGDCSPAVSFGICSYMNYTSCDEEETKDNHYYKLIETIDYPFNKTLMTREELVIAEVQYKIHSLGRVFGRYFNDDRNRAEIPLEDLTYNDDGPFITIPELLKLLDKIGYKVRECNAYKSQKSVPCVIYEPIVMESSSSPTSEANPSDYENWPTEDEGNISDWDAPPADELAKRAGPLKEPQMYASEVLCDIIKGLDSPRKECTEGSGQASDGLADSGYQRSVSNLEGSPETPPDVADAVVFSESLQKNGISQKGKSGKGNSNARHGSADSKLSNEGRLSLKPPPPPAKKKDNKEPLPGTSKKKKNKRLECEEDIVHEDMRNFTECVVINALNKVEDPKPILIEEVNAEENLVVEELPLPVVAVVEEVAVVENGDLVNNNRDIEGNNYPDEHVEDVAQVELENDVPAEEDIRNEDYQNRNEAVFVDAQDQPQGNPFPEENPDEDDDDGYIDMELAFASREALYDPNSQPDLLDDFDIPPVSEENLVVSQQLQQLHMLEEQQEEEDQQTVILVGMLHVNDEDGVILPGHADPFPNWLLQLLGAEYIEDGNQHDEPHFYCQGDGVGVHPSVIEVDIDEEASTSEDSSSNTTMEDPEAERTVSDQEVGSLPEDVTENSQGATAETNLRTTEAVAVASHSSVVWETPQDSSSIVEESPVRIMAGPSNESNEEFFDSLDDTEKL